MPTILVTEKLGDTGVNLLKEFANVDCSYNLSPEKLCTKISLCDVLTVRSGTKVSREVFELSVRPLKVVGRAGVGIDIVDLAAATEHGCLVVNALLAAMARNVAQANASVKADGCMRGSLKILMVNSLLLKNKLLQKAGDSQKPLKLYEYINGLNLKPTLSMMNALITALFKGTGRKNLLPPKMRAWIQRNIMKIG